MSAQEQISALLHTAEDALNEAERIAYDNDLDFTFAPTNGASQFYDGREDRWEVLELEEWASHQGHWLSSSC